VAGTPGNAQVNVSWTAPASNGGSVITDYAVQYAVSPPGSVFNNFSHTASPATSMIVTGLTNGTGYVFRVAAINAIGQSAYSTTSAVVTPSTVITPAVRDMTGGNLIFSIGNSAADTFNTCTFAAVIRRGSDNGSRDDPVLQWEFSNGAAVGGMWVAGNRLGFNQQGVTWDPQGPFVTVSNGWVLIAITKPAGSAVLCRKHRVSFTGGTTEHLDGAFGFYPFTAPGVDGRFVIGRENNPALNFDGDVAGAGVFPTALSDSNIESLLANWDRWVTLGAKHLWVMDQTSTATAVNDSISGGNANQLSVTGTSVTAAAAPIKWA
jgi:hypothetical protein